MNTWTTLIQMNCGGQCAPTNYGTCNYLASGNLPVYWYCWKSESLIITWTSVISKWYVKLTSILRTHNRLLLVNQRMKHVSTKLKGVGMNPTLRQGKPITIVNKVNILLVLLKVWIGYNHVDNSNRSTDFPNTHLESAINASRGSVFLPLLDLKFSCSRIMSNP